MARTHRMTLQLEPAPHEHPARGAVAANAPGRAACDGTRRPHREHSRWGRVMWGPAAGTRRKQPVGGLPDVIEPSPGATTPPGRSRTVNECCRSVDHRSSPTHRGSVEPDESVGSGPDRPTNRLVTRRICCVAVGDEFTVSRIPAAEPRGCHLPGSDDILPRAASRRLIVDYTIGLAASAGAIRSIAFVS